MSTARRLHFSYQDYLSALEVSEFKLEYCEGVIYAMAGGTPTHAELSLNTCAILMSRLSFVEDREVVRRSVSEPTLAD